MATDLLKPADNIQDVFIWLVTACCKKPDFDRL